MLSTNEMDISKQNVKLPFAGATPANSTEEMEKSVTPAIADAGETTSPPQLATLKENVNGALPVAAVAPEINAVPDALVYKYNRYCDRIYERIGAILKTKYDPVSVLLSTSITKKQGVKKTAIKKKKR